MPPRSWEFQRLLFTLSKVDAPQRLVYGWLDETPDAQGEAFDYTSSKPHFEAWSKSQAQLSDGKSLGNLRVMHGMTVAGLITGVEFDDDMRRIGIIG